MTARPTYKIAKDQGGTWEFLVDAFESSTTYHREPADVKVKVGAVGYLGLSLMLSLCVYMVYLLFTTNWWLSEAQPMYSSFAHWPTGGTSSQTANDQWKEGGLCTYQDKYDYWYGMPPGLWNYAGNTCEVMSYTEYAFKATNSLHLVTYEQRRSNVLVPVGKHADCSGKTGDELATCQETSCDTACKTDGYAEWPTAAEFRADAACAEGSEARSTMDCWMSVHVATDAHERLKVEHPDLAAKPQMHLRMPQLSGGDCSCYSLENVFVLGVDDAVAHFTHGFEAYDGGVSGSFKLSRDEDTNSPKSFMLARGPNAQTEPFKVIDPEPGTTVSFSVREALEALGTSLDSPGPSSMFDNSLCPETGECTGAYQLEPTQRMSGMTLTVRTLYFSHKETTPDTYAVIRDNYDPPYAIHVVSAATDWTSRGSDVVREINTPDLKKDVDRYRYGVLIKYVPAAGVISRFDFNVVIQTLVNFTVLLGFPPMLMSGIVFVALGRKSKLYRRGQRKTLTLEGMHRSFAYNAVIAGAIFSNLDENGDGFLDVTELEKCFKNLLEPKLRSKFPGEKQEWYDARVREFVEFMSESFHVEGVPEEGCENETNVEAGSIKVGISHTEFVSNCLRNEPLDWDDMMDKLVDPSIDADPELPCRQRKKNKVVPNGSDNYAG